MSAALRPERIELWDVMLPLRRALRSATGDITGRRSIVVAAVAGAETGWGESAPVVGHSLDTPDEAWQLLTVEAERVLAGEEPAVIEGSTASAALDTALLDLAARHDGRAPAVRLGGDLEPVPASAAVSLPRSEEELLDAAAAAVTAGYRHVKVKVDPAAAAHLPTLRAAHPALGIAVDANGSFASSTAELLVELDGLGLDYVEQPFPAGDGSVTAELRSVIAAPVCLDESIRRLADIPAAAGHADAVTLKPGRLGPTLTRHAAAVARRHGLGVRIGGMVETGIGRSVLVASATLPAVTLTGDLAATAWYFDEDLVVPPWELEGGCLVPRAALEVDTDALARHATARRVIG